MEETGTAQAEKIIRITCQGADTLPIDSLLAFQGNLKSLSEKEFDKLSKAIIKAGFSFPVFVWRDGDENYIIDGHQRLYVVKKMVEGGWGIEGDGRIPVDWIHADSRKEAKEKVLLAASQYGRIDMESLYEYIETEELDFESLKEMVDIPTIKLEVFEKGYMPEPGAGEKEVDENIETEFECPRCGYKWSGKSGGDAKGRP
jgi:hypothetical protein